MLRSGKNDVFINAAISFNILYIFKERRLREAFNYFDRDGSGKIDRLEFIEACKVLKLPETEMSFGALFDIMDADDSNFIDFYEFRQATKTKLVSFYLHIFCHLYAEKMKQTYTLFCFSNKS